MEVRVVGERRAPCMEHRGETDAGAEVLGVGGDGDQGLGGGLEQDACNIRFAIVFNYLVPVFLELHGFCTPLVTSGRRSAARAAALGVMCA